ncbi:hypothetical protein NPS70_16415 [Streptomyces sp. C10-9-1]|uniref:hypothetical protein n=1 Tax=Streptomyces sp. C10-9-1 TaxID=1859285 RepID=UPI00211178AC|nr:hypothetical protein [Streptomyces sp. C10-9-1]MCQ6554770.1 hypothetical protein [Streptomyces sp. C10-9-1]
MSAWTDLVARAKTPDELAALDAALVEIQTEYASRLARQIRHGHPDRSPDFADGAEWAADFIDPSTRCVGCGNPQSDGQAHGFGAEFGGCV